MFNFEKNVLGTAPIDENIPGAIFPVFPDGNRRNYQTQNSNLSFSEMNG